MRVLFSAMCIYRCSVSVGLAMSSEAKRLIDRAAADCRSLENG